MTMRRATGSCRSRRWLSISSPSPYRNHPQAGPRMAHPVWTRYRSRSSG